jgi:hypothetical protein
MGEKDLDPSWLNPKLRWEAPAEEEIAGNETVSILHVACLLVGCPHAEDAGIFLYSRPL